MRLLAALTSVLACGPILAEAQAAVFAHFMVSDFPQQQRCRTLTNDAVSGGQYQVGNTK
jgi:hypothetical protein